jgi:hypothetical protein
MNRIRTDGLFLTKEQLVEWLNLTPWELRQLLEDEAFIGACAINVARAGAKKRNLRFEKAATAGYLAERAASVPQLADIKAAA